MRYDKPVGPGMLTKKTSSAIPGRKGRAVRRVGKKPVLIL